MQRLSRPLPACGPSSASKPLWSRSRSQPLPLSLSRIQFQSLSLPGKARSVFKRGRRHWPKKIRQVPMRDAYPIYDLSGLILDLDAEGNKHVRRYDPTTDGVRDPSRTAHKYEQLALTKRVNKFEDRYRRGSEQFGKISTQEYTPWHVSDLDIISCALLGPSLKGSSQHRVQGESLRTNDTASSRFEEIAGTVQRQNGIPRHAQEDTARGVAYLMRRQKKHITAAPDLDAGVFSRQIDKCGNLTELRRVVQNLLVRPGGCKLVNSYGHDIAKRCQALELTASQNELEEILSFLNDVTIRTASDELPMSPHIAGVGLRIAASYGAFSAMQLYFAATECWRRDSIASYVNTALARALFYLTSQPGYKKDESGAQESRASRVAAYTTLTGYSMYGQDFEMSYQKAIRTQPGDPLRHHQHFLHMLAEVGAFRTIWHIFHKSNRGEAPLIPYEHRDWFVTAILRALGNVQSGRITFDPKAVKHATGDYEADCKLDLRTIMSSSIDNRPTKAPCASMSKSSGLRENASLDDEVSGLYENIGPEVVTQKMRSDILEALHLHTIAGALSRLRKILYAPASK
ncbi:hypothetical protein PG994_011047 [Apiospora phragmitis]|uniref:Uncharacterized protein n=1 Tax=Apiospora phragmitis TaxID=2905665 RepID=A0ABR1TRX2_9PEZI